MKPDWPHETRVWTGPKIRLDYHKWKKLLCKTDVTLIFLSQPIVRASKDTAVLGVENNGPGGLLSQTAFNVFFCCAC